MESSFTSNRSDTSSSIHGNRISPSKSPNFNLEEDPSFSSSHFETSTPLKPRRTRTRSAHEDSLEEEDGLRQSDTESLDFDDDEEEGRTTTASKIRLTRRSLAKFSSVSSPSVNNITTRPNPTLTTTTTTTRLSPNHYMARDLSAQSGIGYAPTPSTGSSTLVEKDEYPTSRTNGKGKERAKEDITIKPSAPLGVYSEHSNENEIEDDGSSSSPRPLKPSKRLPQEIFSSYVDLKASSTPPSHYYKQLSLQSTPAPSTPIAPGAYPPTNRKPRNTTRTLISTSSPTTTTTSSAATQVQEAFTKYIHGPEGALHNSAERRNRIKSTPSPPKYSHTQFQPTTPHPSGYYPPTPSSSTGMGKRSPLPFRTRLSPSSEPLDPGDEASEEEIANTTPSLAQPNKRKFNLKPSSERDLAATKVYRTLREIERSQARESESEEEEDRVAVAGAERSHVRFAMEDSYRHPAPQEDDDEGKEEEVPQEFVPPRSPSPPLPPPLEVTPQSSPTKPARKRQSTPPSSSKKPILPSTSPFRTTPSPQSHSPPPIKSSPSQHPLKTSTSTNSLSLSSSTSLARRSALARQQPQDYLPEPKKEVDDGPVLSLLSELVDGIRNISSAGLNEKGLPRKREEKESLGAELRRRRKESEERRKGWEEEFEDLDREEDEAQEEKKDLMLKSHEADEIERGLAIRVDELRKSVEAMGVKVGAEVSAVVGEVIRTESRKRGNWLAWLFVAQLVLLWLMIRFANMRAQHLFQTVYYDPFYPALFLPPSSSSSRLLPETIHLFSPSPSSSPSSFWTALDFVSKWFGRGKDVANGVWVPS